VSSEWWEFGYWGDPELVRGEHEMSQTCQRLYLPSQGEANSRHMGTHLGIAFEKCQVFLIAVKVLGLA